MDVKKPINLAVLPGDGVGNEVTLAALPIFKALNIPVNIQIGDIGWKFWCKEGNCVPDRTWKLMKNSDATLLGSTTSKPERETLAALPDELKNNKIPYVSPLIQIRQNLNLFANVRPCYSLIDGTKEFNFCIIRENSEGLYAGLDYYPITDDLKKVIDEKEKWRNIDNNDLSCSLRLQSKQALKRLFKFAFEYAKRHHMSRVTLADKPNVLRKSSILSRELFEEIATTYPDIKAEILNVDAIALWLVKRPGHFGVIVAENMFGDILSDLGAGVMGGLGFAPSVNIGEKDCYFEPVHGSAPLMKKNTANPSAMFLTISLLLEHFNFNDEASLIKQAVKNVIYEKKCLTYDLGGTASTKEMADAIINQVVQPFRQRKISIIATGDEIVSGDIQNTSGCHFAKTISQKNGEVHQHICVTDFQSDIEDALEKLLNESDAVILTGGLGPTCDDNTRFALSAVTKLPLIFNEPAWKHVVERLKKFNLQITDSNKQQALFPENATLLNNAFGTALACHVVWKNKHIFMLPGPPKESWPIFENDVMDILSRNDFFNQKKITRFLTLGLIEGEISEELEEIKQKYNIEIGYRWCYPYLEIKIIQHYFDNSIEVIDQIKEFLSEHSVSNNEQNAIYMLKDHLSKFKKTITVANTQTMEELSAEITDENFQLSNDKKSMISITTKRIGGTLELKTTGQVEGFKYEHNMTSPYRDEAISSFIKHYAAWQICKYYRVLFDENTS